ncbi:MAG TPA: outer-membrane lipoprotein carrier protein LolA [Phycisphaerae bacterium]|nr:outer-membrane lipoprotein carrier protein LolA [Phycisphaerae bacterium]
MLILAIAAMGQGEAPEPTSKELASHWGALKDVRTLSLRFFCEKDLAALETPLQSGGRVWIRKGENGQEGAVRFSTEMPYISELILTDGKVYARSQHETDWTKTNQSSRPGLTAVMRQLGGWATGNASAIEDMYSVSRGDGVPAMPGAKDPESNFDVFILTPSNKDLAKSVKRVTLGIDRTQHTLHYIEILTQQDDATKYWFFDVKANAELPPGVFKPDGDLLVHEGGHS